MGITIDLKKVRDNVYSEMKLLHPTWYREVIAQSSIVILNNQLSGKAATDIEYSMMSLALYMLRKNREQDGS